MPPMPQGLFERPKKAPKPKGIDAHSFDKLPVENDLLYGTHGSRKTLTLPSCFGAPNKPKYIDDYPLLGQDNRGQKANSELLKDLTAFVNENPNAKFHISGKKNNNENVRRKCKAGLAWALQKDADMRVHFSLDELNLSDVIRKTSKGKNRDKPGTGSEAKNRAITGSELRFLYRNRHNENLDFSRLIFWNRDVEGDDSKFKVVPAPWEKDTNSLDSYDEDGEPVIKTYKAAEWNQYTPGSSGTSTR